MDTPLKQMPLEERQEYLVRLEDELLLGGAAPSEWAVFPIQATDTAFCAGADLAALLTAQAAMETQLRHLSGDGSRLGFAKLIDRSGLPDDLAHRLHEIRRFRNRWVHVNDPDDDQELLQEPEKHRRELEHMAIVAMRAMMEVLFLEQWL